MADIRNLTLLSNDPDEAARLLTEAERGDVDAQYAMGLIYAEGRGLPLDEARAYLWLTLAGQQGDEDALMLRRMVVLRMNDAQFEEARRLLEARRGSGNTAIGADSGRRPPDALRDLH